MSGLNPGPAIYMSLNNINVPSLDDFNVFFDNGLARALVFTFVPNDQSPTTPEWYTTKEGNQPQGLDTNGSSSVQDWQDFFKSFTDKGVQVGFTFGGEGATAGLSAMMNGLNDSTSDFQAFVDTLNTYHVSFIEFDIEGDWNTAAGFSTAFQTFATNLTQYGEGALSVQVGASAPIGTVNDAASDAPSYLTPQFVAANNVYFNVYTYYELEVDTILDDPTPWIPSDTDIPPGNILFATTCNNTTPAPDGQITFQTFMEGLPDSNFLATVKGEDYLGIIVWIWWDDATYPFTNCAALFEAIA